jgi:hypothetical protein
MYKDQWGTHPRYYINFELLQQYSVKGGGIVRQLYVSEKDRVLCDSITKKVLPDHIQEIYRVWSDAEVERMLTGDASS